MDFEITPQPSEGAGRHPRPSVRRRTVSCLGGRPLPKRRTTEHVTRAAARTLTGACPTSASAAARVPAVDELGYCGHCHWTALAEIEEGFRQIREYLDLGAVQRLVRSPPASPPRDSPLDRPGRKSCGALRA